MKQRGEVQKMGLAQSQTVGTGVGKPGFPYWTFSADTHGVEDRSLTALGKSPGLGIHICRSCQIYCCRKMIFLSNMCCNYTAALHVGCSDGLGGPLPFPSTRRVTAKRVWSKAATGALSTDCHPLTHLELQWVCCFLSHLCLVTVINLPFLQ